MNATNSSTCNPNAPSRFLLWAISAYLVKLLNDYKALHFVDLPTDLGQGIGNVKAAEINKP